MQRQTQNRWLAMSLEFRDRFQLEVYTWEVLAHEAMRSSEIAKGVSQVEERNHKI